MWLLSVNEIMLYNRTRIFSTNFVCFSFTRQFTSLTPRLWHFLNIERQGVVGYLNIASLQIYQWVSKWKKIWKSAHIWWSNVRKYSGIFFYLDTQYATLLSPMAVLRLKLNSSKTQFIWNICHFLETPPSCHVLPCTWLWHFTTQRNINETARLKAHAIVIWEVYYVSRETMIQLVMSLVISWVDYCNCVLVGLPASTLAPLQRVQNAADRLILSLSRRSHITPAFKQLHWLPVKFCIISKLPPLCTTFFTNILKDLLTFSISISHQQPGLPMSVEQ